VLIVGTIVWIGITQRPNRGGWIAASTRLPGFALPFLPRGLDEIPRSPNDQDVVITVYKGKPAARVERECRAAQARFRLCRHLPSMASDTGYEPSRFAATNRCRWPWGATYDDTVAEKETNNLHRRVILICFVFAIGAAAVLGWLLATFAVRAVPPTGAARPGPSDAGG